MTETQTKPIARRIFGFSWKVLPSEICSKRRAAQFGLCLNSDLLTKYASDTFGEKQPHFDRNRANLSIIPLSCKFPVGLL